MKIKSLAFASLIVASAFASADTVTTTVDVAGLASWDGLYDSSNYSSTYDLSAIFSGYENFVLTGIGWDNVGLETVGASWLSEVTFSFESFSGVEFLDVSPGFEFEESGTGNFSSGGLIDLVAENATVTMDPDNLLFFHIWEDFDDVADAIDANIASGTFTLQFEAQPVPEPATLAALGVGAAALIRRRRNKRA